MTPTAIPLEIVVTLADGGAAVITRSASYGDIAIVALLAALCATTAIRIMLTVVDRSGERAADN